MKIFYDLGQIGRARLPPKIKDALMQEVRARNRAFSQNASWVGLLEPGDRDLSGAGLVGPLELLPVEASWFDQDSGCYVIFAIRTNEDTTSLIVPPDTFSLDADIRKLVMDNLDTDEDGRDLC